MDLRLLELRERSKRGEGLIHEEGEEERVRGMSMCFKINLFLSPFLLNVRVSFGFSLNPADTSHEYYSFVGCLRTNVRSYFSCQACVCIKSRVLRILNVKVSLQCFVFILCFSRRGRSNTTGDSETNTRPESIQHAVSMLAPKLLHTRD